MSNNIDYFTSEPMKYFQPPNSMTKEGRRFKLEQMIKSEQYIFSEKKDGNWARCIITPERSALQTRGISKKTGQHGEIQDKVIWFKDIQKAFESHGTTVLLGEVILDGGIDRDVGSILRCLPSKALERQRDNPLKFYIFDVLAYDGVDLMQTPIAERIKYIPKCVKRIGSDFVSGATYYEMDNKFFERIAEVFDHDGEGVVCYRKSAIYEPGKRGPHAWDSVKVKREIENEIDCFITKIIPCEKNYTGKDLPNAQFWMNTRTGEKVNENKFTQYQLGESWEPISRSYYYDYPGAVEVSVYNSKHEIIPLCNVAGLTDEMRAGLRDDFPSWYMMPITIGGMMVSTANVEKNGLAGISVRHPYIKTLRPEDISVEDCTLERIIY